MSHQPASPHPLRGKCVAIRPQRGHKDQKEGDRQGEDTKRDRVVEPPDQEEQSGNREAQQGFDLTHAYRHPVMRLDQHLDH